MMKDSSREALVEEARQIMEAGWEAINSGFGMGMVDRITVVSGYLQLLTSLPDDPRYEAKLRDAIERLRAAMKTKAHSA